MSSQDDIEMDKDSILLFGITACALGLSLFIFWGPKLSRRGSYNSKLIGLQNLGLTCFLNSLLQGLAACPSLLDWLEPCQGNGYVSSSLYTILRVLCYERQPDDGTEAVISPEDLIYGLRRKNYWSSLQEQDPHELFLHLISAVEEEEQKAKPQRSNSLLDALDLEDKALKNGRGPEEQCQGDAPQLISRSIQQPLTTSRLVSPFRGYLASQLCCLRCGHKSAVVYDKFDTLSLALPAQSLHNSTYGLGRLLSDFVRAELVDGFSCDGCSAEHGPSQASKAIKIGKLPKCLCFHICRTVIDSGGYIYKRENTVVFPEHLSMSEYTHTSHMINEKKKLKLKGGDAEMVAAVRNGSLVDENSIAAALNNNFSLPVMKGPIYQLKAVVEHRGTVESGHFVTYRRGPLEQGDSSPTDAHHQSRWYYTSDNIVKKSSLNEVLTASAYLLFYEKTVFPAL